MQRVFTNVTLAVLLVSMGVLVTDFDTAHAQGRSCFKDVNETITFTNPFTGATITTDRTIKEFDDDCAFIQDNRQNVNDLAAGAAIYCTPAGIDIYDLGISGAGTFAFRATWAEVENVPVNPEQNTLIDSDGVIGLYRLTTGEMQVNAWTEDYPPQPYVFIWDGCSQEDAS